ncbi:MAG: ribosomal protein S18-alanine N-acetyltransferase, partial [Terriglobales bacterium]
TQACAGYAAAQWLGGGEAELQSLAVRPESRRAGIGAALLAEALAALRRLGVRTVFLEVREGNAAAQAFYRRAGFKIFGRRPRYYREPDEAAVLMRIAAL